MSNAQLPPIERPGTMIRHYKGGIYQVIGVGEFTEQLPPSLPTNELLAYKNLKDNKLWFRPIHMFYETVEFNGKHVPRFTIIKKDGDTE